MKLKLTVLFILINFLTFSQSIESLKSECEKMYDATYTMDFEKIVMLTYPKLFEIIDKEAMLTMLDQTFQNEMLRVRLVHPKTTFAFSEVKETEGKKICIVEYPQSMRMIFEKPLTDDQKTAMETSFKTSMATKKITFEKGRNAFLIEGKDKIIAISDAQTQHQWKFINYDPNQLELLNSMLGENVVKQLGL